MKRMFTFLTSGHGWRLYSFLIFFTVLPFSYESMAQCGGFSVTVDAPAWYTFCPGDPIDLVANPSGGTAPYSYGWSTGGNQQIETIPGPSTSMNITVTVTDANGCEAIATAHIKPVNLNPIIYGSPTPVCEFVDSVELVVTGAGDFSYLWSTGETTQSIYVNETGTYSVTVTHILAGCTAELSIFQEFYPLPTIELIAPAALCPEMSADLQIVGGSFSSYLWSTGETSPSINVSGSGFYSVTVQDFNNCPAEDEVEILPLPVIPPEVSAPPFLCPDQEGTIEVANAANYAIFQWDNGASSSSIEGMGGQYYAVTVTDFNGCTESGELFVDVFFTIPPFLFGETQICEGQQTTNLNVEPSFEEYSWSNGETTQNIEITESGIYAVTVTDVNGCTTEGEQEVLAAPIPSPVIVPPATNCTGSSVTLVLDEGPFAEYNWSTGENDPTIDVNQSGVYAVTVTNDEGCTSDTDLNVEINSGPTAAISVISYTCNGNITLEASGGTNYDWSNGETTASIDVSSSGEYTVTVSDENGCTDEYAESVTIPAPPVVSINGPAGLCTAATGILSVTTGFVQYEWSNGETGDQINIEDPGTYEVIATDTYGCTVSAEWTVGSFAPPTVAITGPASICNGSSATLSVPNNFNQIEWSTGATVQSISISQNGMYEVTVTDANGCTNADSHELEIGNNLTPVITETVDCEGDATLNAGSGFSTYLWSNGATGSSITVNTNGNYTVTVSDGSGCTGEGVISLTIPPTPSISISGLTEICEGGSTALTADAGFTLYEWSNGANNSAITVSQSGTYNVTATDGNGCTAEASQIFEAHPLPDVNINAPASICTGNEATLSLSGNFAQIEWSNGESTPTIQASQAGIYTVIVTDDHGCTSSDDHELEITESLTTTIDVSTSCDETATLEAGAGFTDYLWSNGATGQTITVSNEGNYTVTISDATGCSGEISTQVSIPLPPEININGPVEACEDEIISLQADTGFDSYEWSNGEITSNIEINQSGTYTVIGTDQNGCTAEASHMFEYFVPPAVSIEGPSSICNGHSTALTVIGDFSQVEWNDGSTDPQITVSQSGNYSVIVTDANGCTNNTNHLLDIADALLPVISIANTDCDGTAILEADDGYTNYEWSNGESGQSISVNTEGQYFVTVTNASGCTGEDEIMLSLPTPPTVSILGPTSICTGSSTTFYVAGNYAQVEWSTGSTDTQIDIADAGIYSVTVTSLNGCTATDEQQLDVADSLYPQITTTLEDCDGTTTLDAGGGYDHYIWSNGATAATTIINNNGTYQVTVTDITGCSGTAEIEVVLPAAPVVTIVGVQTLCEGDNTTLIAPGDFVQYLWSTGETSQSIVVDQGGNYAVTVSDENGCTAFDEWSITEIQTDYTYLQESACSTLDTGTVEMILQNQFGCDSIVILNTTLAPSMSTTIELSACDGESVNFNGTQLEAGTTEEFYFNAANGCDSIVTVHVNAYPAINYETTSIPSCPNQASGELQIYDVSGTAPFSYLLNGNQQQTSPTFSNLPSGEHFLMVSDANGCILASSIEIPTQEPTEILIEDSELSCDQQTVVLQPEIISGDPADIHFWWPDASTNSWLEVSEAGVYNLKVDDGCEVQEFPIYVDWAVDYQDRDFFFIPNAFSPNQDGINDIFKVFPGEDFTLKSFELMVFDRWGDMMFGTTNIADGWDGIHRGVQKQPAVFVWYVKAKVELCGNREIDFYKEGGVTISR